MAYSDDAVLAKLSALNESQDSVVTVAQWIMFHRRHADRTASLWLNRLQESTSPGKRLNLIYLANEIVQQSRARSRTDFQQAFEPLVTEATALAYKGANQDVQTKLRRVIEVWRQRQIFELRVQDEMEKRLEELDKQKGGKAGGLGGGRLGGSLFGGSGGSVAPELDGVNKTLTTLSKAEAASKAPVTSANAEYGKQTDPNTPLPSAPMRASKLQGLAKALRAAQGAVEASIRARKELIAGLEKLVDNHRSSLATEESTSSDLAGKISRIESTIRDVEDSIMRGQDAATPPLNGNSNGGMEDPERPEPEGFTPPPQDDSTEAEDAGPLIGDGTPLDQMYTSSTGADPIEEQPPNRNEPPPAFEPPPALEQEDPTAAAKEFLESLNMPQVRHASGEIPAVAATGTAGDPRLKRRKMSHRSDDDIDEEIFGAGNVGGVDEESISAMLAQ